MSQRIAPLFICGPTAVGKTNLALKLARKLGGEIVNVDSVQIYKEFDIGSSKPSPRERSLVPHHLFDFCDPRDRFDVAKFISLAVQKFLELTARGVLPIFTGGSSMYITLLISGILKLPPADELLRSEFSEIATDELYLRLEKSDPAAAKSIHRNDRMRIIRALEIISSQQTELEQDTFYNQFERSGIGPALILVPLLNRETLYQRINQRVGQMMQLGWLDETRRLITRYGLNCPPMQSLGYKQIGQALSSQSFDQSQLEQEIAMQTRRFAKRQLTFWRNEPVKKGWFIRPSGAGENMTIDLNDLSLQTGRRPGSQLTYDFEFSDLIEQVQPRLTSLRDTSEVWFLNGEKVNK